MATTCETCVHFNQQTLRCGAYDMPAEMARAMPSFCGDAGADHVRRPGDLADRMDWIVVGVLTILLAGAVFLKLHPQFLTWLLAVLS